jgi:hypothetical protein
LTVFLPAGDDLPTLATFWTDTLAKLQNGKPVSPDDGKALWLILAGINEPSGQKLIRAIHEQVRRETQHRQSVMQAHIALLEPEPAEGLAVALETYQRKQRRAKELIADKNPKG